MILIGHRGARGEAPENTLPGFHHLRSLGIHHVELDIRLSADGQLMVVHDTTVNRTCNATGEISDFTAQALNSMNATSHFKSWPKVSGIPTLDQVLSQWHELASIQLEVKTANRHTLSVIAHGLCTLIETHGLQKKAIITSSDTQMLALAHQLLPNIQRGFVAERFVRSPIEVCLNYECTHLVINHHRCSPGLIANAQNLGLEVSTWTVNDINTAKRLMNWGIDSIITDIPSQLMPYAR